mgnify:CR=1 FL=1
MLKLDNNIQLQTELGGNYYIEVKAEDNLGNISSKKMIFTVKAGWYLRFVRKFGALSFHFENNDIENLCRNEFKNHTVIYNCGFLNVCVRPEKHSQMKHSRYGVVNWFVRLGMDGEDIPVFGDGKIKRDFLFIDDCIEAILLSGVNKNAIGEVINVGHDQPQDFLQIVKIP